MLATNFHHIFSLFNFFQFSNFFLLFNLSNIGHSSVTFFITFQIFVVKLFCKLLSLFSVRILYLCFSLLNFSSNKFGTFFSKFPFSLLQTESQACAPCKCKLSTSEEWWKARPPPPRITPSSCKLWPPRWKRPPSWIRLDRPHRRHRRVNASFQVMGSWLTFAAWATTIVPVKWSAVRAWWARILTPRPSRLLGEGRNMAPSETPRSTDFA